MMRHLAIIFACLLLLVGITAASFTQMPSRLAVVNPNGNCIGDPLIPPLSIELAQDPFAHDSAALPHAHGENLCASGCAASRHPTKPLEAAAFEKLLATYQQAIPDGDNPALEQILFYGRQSRQYWRQRAHSVDPLWRTVLDEELEKTHVLLSLRIVDESGKVRSRIAKIRVPLDRRHVFSMQTNGLQPLITSGTVKRVGLDHLWTRL